MTFNEYKEAAYVFAVYPRELQIMYPMLGLNGEIAELVAAMNDAEETNSQALRKVQDEIGDILWYVAALATDLDMEFEGLIKDYTNTKNNYVANALLDLFVAAGLLSNTVKKILRDEEMDRDMLYLLLAMTLTRVATLCDIMGLDPDEIASQNLSKLQGRFTRGTIHGNGDER